MYCLAVNFRITLEFKNKKSILLSISKAIKLRESKRIIIIFCDRTYLFLCVIIFHKLIPKPILSNDKETEENLLQLFNSIKLICVNTTNRFHKLSLSLSN